MATTMTVSELRQLLQDLPDDAPVLIRGEDYGPPSCIKSMNTDIPTLPLIDGEFAILFDEEEAENYWECDEASRKDPVQYAVLFNTED